MYHTNTGVLMSP